MNTIDNVINEVINNINDNNDRKKVQDVVSLLTSLYEKDKNEELKYKRKNNLLKKKINALEKIQLLQEVFIAENRSQNEQANKPSTQLTTNNSLISESNNWKQKVYELLVQNASNDELHVSEINKYKSDINNYSEALKLKNRESEILKEQLKRIENELENKKNENMKLKSHNNDITEQSKLLEVELKNKNDILLTLLMKMEKIQNNLSQLSTDVTKK